MIVENIIPRNVNINRGANIIPRNVNINRGCASVDIHIPRDDIFDYYPRRKCYIYIMLYCKIIIKKLKEKSENTIKSCTHSGRIISIQFLFFFFYYSVIVSVCRGPCARGIYSTHGTPSFMHPLWLQKRNSIGLYPALILRLSALSKGVGH